MAGCGSSSSSTGTSVDPASAVPASAPLYAGAVVRPEGALKDAAQRAGRTLTHQTDPYLRLLGVLETPGSRSLDFKRDVAPWLGPQAGVFLANAEESQLTALLSLLQAAFSSSSSPPAFPFAARGVEGALVLDTSDTSKARAFLQVQASRAGASATSYRGIAYRASPGGVAFGLVKRLVVVGSERGLRAVIDTTSGGPSLADAAGYAKLAAATPSGTLAHFFVNPAALAIRGSGGGLGSAVSALAGGRLLNISLIPSSGSIGFDADALAGESSARASGAFTVGGGASKALGELPGESWFAVGLGNVAATLAPDVQALAGLTSLAGSSTSAGAPSQGATLSLPGLLGGMLAPLRALGASDAQAKHDFASWMGAAGLFAAGSGLLELKGGVAIDSKDPALSRAAVAKLGERLKRDGASIQRTSVPGTEAAVAAHVTGLPVVLDIAAGKATNGQSKFVIGIGEASVDAALNPSSPLSASSAYGAASAALGGIQPSISVDFPTLVSLLEGIGLNEDPTIAPVLPYLRSLTTLSGGGKSLGGGIERFRLVLGLQGG